MNTVTRSNITDKFVCFGALYRWDLTRPCWINHLPKAQDSSVSGVFSVKFVRVIHVMCSYRSFILMAE